MKNYITNIIACFSITMAAFFGCVSLEQSKELAVKQETITDLGREIYRLENKIDSLDSQLSLAISSNVKYIDDAMKARMAFDRLQNICK